jgi:CheY-like chemotaxis protein
MSDPVSPSLDHPGGGAAVVELAYRTPGSFLVAYVTQLARGVLFVETPTRLPTGTPVSLRLVAPSAPVVTMDGVVASARAGGVPGLPAGLSLTLAPLADEWGPAVDRIAAGFAGFRVLLATAEAAPRAILGRYLRSITTCMIIDVDESAGPSPELATLDLGTLDLAVLDVDSCGPRAFEIGDRVQQRPRPAPVLALAQLERDRERALRAGCDEALPNPPAFADLQAAVLRCLAKPIATHQGTKYSTLKGYAHD